MSVKERSHLAFLKKTQGGGELAVQGPTALCSVYSVFHFLHVLLLILRCLSESAFVLYAVPRVLEASLAKHLIQHTGTDVKETAAAAVAAIGHLSDGCSPPSRFG